MVFKYRLKDLANGAIHCDWAFASTISFSPTSEGSLPLFPLRLSTFSESSYPRHSLLRVHTSRVQQFVREKSVSSGMRALEGPLLYLVEPEHSFRRHNAKASASAVNVQANPRGVDVSTATSDNERTTSSEQRTTSTSANECAHSANHTERAKTPTTNTTLLF